jgi:DNA-binding transcriptional regulator YiaG
MNRVVDGIAVALHHHGNDGGAAPMQAYQPAQIPEQPPLDTFGKRLRRSREYRHLTGVQLAELLEVPSQTLSTWERGAIPTKPDPFTVAMRCSEVLGVDLLWDYQSVVHVLSAAQL